jgi:hypothetical protein
MSIENNMLWQHWRPNGYELARDEIGTEYIAKKKDVHTQDKFQPSSTFFSELINRSSSSESILDFVNHYGSLFNDDADGDYVAPYEFAMEEISEVFADYLQGRTDKYPAEKISKLWEENVSKDITVVIVKNDEGKLEKKLLAKNLITDIWINVISLLLGEKQFVQCELDRCNTWFEIPINKTGNPQRFCKDSHRVAAARQKAKAKQTS